MKRLLFAFVSLALIGAAIAGQPQQRFRVPGVYSNLSHNNRSGDLIGMELLIIPSGSGYVACIQIAEGGSPDVTVVPFSVNGARVEFTLPAGSEYAGQHFTGSFTDSGTKLVLYWPSGWKEVLVRGKSYWE